MRIFRFITTGAFAATAIMFCGAAAPAATQTLQFSLGTISGDAKYVDPVAPGTA